MSDQLVAETVTKQLTINIRDEYPCPQQDSNPISQQSRASDLRLSPHGHRDRSIFIVDLTFSYVGVGGYDEYGYKVLYCFYCRLL